MARLIMAVISTLLEEAALVVIALWGLPKIGVNLPLPALLALMALWAAYSFVTYRLGSQALRQKPLLSLPHMVGCKGDVVRTLVPEGMVRIRGELWIAQTDGAELQPGAKVVVVEQEGLKLLVREIDTGQEKLT